MLSRQEVFDLRALPIHELGAMARDQSTSLNGNRIRRYRGVDFSVARWLSAENPIEPASLDPETNLIRVTTGVPASLKAEALLSAAQQLSQSHSSASFIVGTAWDWELLAQRQSRPLNEWWETLASLGNVAISGGYAENALRNESLDPEIRFRTILPNLIRAAEYGLSIHAVLGYRRGESEQSFLEDLIDLREFQENHHAVRSLSLIGIPNEGVWTAGVEDLRHTSLARLVASNVDEIRVCAQPDGLPLDPCLLHYGANAVDDTLIRPRVDQENDFPFTHDPTELDRWIAEAGFLSVPGPPESGAETSS